MREPSHSKICQMIGGISRPVIAFKLKDLKVLKEQCLHDLIVKGKIIDKLIAWCPRKVAKSFNVLNMLLKFPINLRILDDGGLRSSMGSLAWSGAIFRLEDSRTLPPWFWTLAKMAMGSPLWIPGWYP